MVDFLAAARRGILPPSATAATAAAAVAALGAGGGGEQAADHQATQQPVPKHWRPDEPVRIAESASICLSRGTLGRSVSKALWFFCAERSEARQYHYGSRERGRLPTEPGEELRRGFA